MKRLSSYLFRVAVLSVLTAVGVVLAVLLVGDWLNERALKASLTPALLAELKGIGEPSAELMNALNAFYSKWRVRALLPVAILLGTIAGGLIGMVHGRRLMRPLDAVAAALADFAQGDLAARARARPSRITEIDAFQDNFNAMADKLARAERELRDQNAAIAHELRTPLTVLIGRLNGMADGVFPLDHDGIQALLTQTDQLHRIIDDLQLLTLADAGRFRLYLEQTDFADIAAQILRAEPGAIETDLRPAPLQADPARLRQMLAVLLNNARRYGGKGLRVETGLENGAAVLRVLDRGPGLTDDAAKRVFDRFWRAEASRGKDGGGSGLGLAVLRSLATAHGGRAEYAHRTGGGAVFTVRLPTSPPKEMSDNPADI